MQKAGQIWSHQTGKLLFQFLSQKPVTDASSLSCKSSYRYHIFVWLYLYIFVRLFFNHFFFIKSFWAKVWQPASQISMSCISSSVFVNHNFYFKVFCPASHIPPLIFSKHIFLWIFNKKSDFLPLFMYFSDQREINPQAKFVPDFVIESLTTFELIKLGSVETVRLFKGYVFPSI